jgi:DNA polymerase IV (DinB-like DNA polymerase)
MLVDLDYFFAQCEELRNPSLKDKPVVVCVYSGRTEDSGAVSTANYVARRFSVKSGIPISLAKKKLEGTEAVFLPVDEAFYEEVSARIVRILRSYADSFEQAGIDEAYLDVSQRVEEDFDKATTLAKTIKEAVEAQVGITCSIGVGPNKLVAKIAADQQKPDGLTAIKSMDIQDFLSPLPVGRLLGVGKKTETKMQDLGIKTIGDLAGFEVQQLVQVFGKKLGVHFHNASMGVDNEPVQEKGEPESISRISTLKENTRSIEAITEETSRLCGEIHVELTRRRLGFRQVGIIVIMKDLSVHSRTVSLPNPTGDLGVLKKTVAELLERFLRESNAEARRVGVKVASLGREEQKPLTSFIDTGS